MKLNPCTNCNNKADEDFDLDQRVGDYLPIVYCPICNKSTGCHPTAKDARKSWNKANPDIKALQQAMLNSLMQRYAVNGKISDVGMPIYDRECLKLLVAHGVLSLSNGLYHPY